MTELEKCRFLKEKGYSYNLETGDIFNAHRKVGYKSSKGYIIIDTKIDKQRYTIKGHRFAWFYFYGELPTKFIDHIDGDRCNNKIENLRDVTKQQNAFNRTKAKGYCWFKRDNKWKAQIQLNQKNIHLGYFESEDSARQAYLEAKKIYHII